MATKDFNVPITVGGRKFARLSVRDFIVFGEQVRQQQRQRIIADADAAGITAADKFRALREHDGGFDPVMEGMRHLMLGKDGVRDALAASAEKAKSHGDVGEFMDNDDLYRQIMGLEDVEPDAPGKAASQPSPATG